jgi:alginate O-acetyltransferase complex protein AlgI
MISIGVWHGAKWTFAAFGALNALYIVGSALTLKPRDRAFRKFPFLARARRIWQPLIVFHLMVVAFVFFRADTMATALTVLRAAAAGVVQIPGAILHRQLSATIEGWSTLYTALVIGGAAIAEAIHWLQAKDRLDAVLDARPRVLRWALYYGVVAAVALFGLQSARGNIYFKF